MNRALRLLCIGCMLTGAAAALAAAAACSLLRPLPAALEADPAALRKPQFLARDGRPLSRTFSNGWNYHDQLPLHQFPPFLVQAVVRSEDKRFWEHRGSDWRALAAALWQDVRALRVVRGGSTISEQVVKLLHPRPRSAAARLAELVEAHALERRFSKAAILEFYLNQVPFARNRRGVAAGARSLFDRDLDTLSPKEMLALAVMIRAPSRFDPGLNGGSGREQLERRILILARTLAREGRIPPRELERITHSQVGFASPSLPLRASHFVRHAAAESGAPGRHIRLRTTIDPALQVLAQKLLDLRVDSLRARRVAHGAVLVLDNATAEVLAWVNSHDGAPAGSQIDAVLAPRQPGSTLKPFLYALALEHGWTAATVIDDLPLLRPVSTGLKEYRNYSGRYHGPLRLREALGNSLNTPAIRTAEFVGPDSFYILLRRLGFQSLWRGPDFYGDGIALGNAEVSLLELVRAYQALANGGVLRGVRLSFDSHEPAAQRVVSAEAASVFADILSDPDARAKEFAPGELLQFPVQTAVKTGTSSDYHDAWAVGFSARFTAGVWMGNLDRTPMADVTGSLGPALLLRSIFSHLERSGRSRPLPKSRRLRAAAVCAETGKRAVPSCRKIRELFLPGTEPEEKCDGHHEQPFPASASAPVLEARIALPPDGLLLALDPRIPDHLEAFPLLAESRRRITRVIWEIDSQRLVESDRPGGRYLWQLSRGRHVFRAQVWEEGQTSPAQTAAVAVTVR